MSMLNNEDLATALKYIYLKPSENNDTLLQLCHGVISVRILRITLKKLVISKSKAFV